MVDIFNWLRHRLILHLLGLLAPRLVLVFADKLSEHADIVALVLKEVKAVHATEPKLEQVVVKRLLRDAH